MPERKDIHRSPKVLPTGIRDYSHITLPTRRECASVTKIGRGSQAQAGDEPFRECAAKPRISVASSATTGDLPPKQVPTDQKATRKSIPVLVGCFRVQNQNPSARSEAEILLRDKDDPEGVAGVVCFLCGVSVLRGQRVLPQ